MLKYKFIDDYMEFIIYKFHTTYYKIFNYQVFWFSLLLTLIFFIRYV